MEVSGAIVEQLKTAARDVSERAYVPYSKYPVGGGGARRRRDDLLRLQRGERLLLSHHLRGAERHLPGCGGRPQEDHGCRGVRPIGRAGPSVWGVPPGDVGARTGSRGLLLLGGRRLHPYLGRGVAALRLPALSAIFSPSGHQDTRNQSEFWCLCVLVVKTPSGLGRPLVAEVAAGFVGDSRRPCPRPGPPGLESLAGRPFTRRWVRVAKAEPQRAHTAVSFSTRSASAHRSAMAPNGRSAKSMSSPATSTWIPFLIRVRTTDTSSWRRTSSASSTATTSALSGSRSSISSAESTGCAAARDPQAGGDLPRAGPHVHGWIEDVDAQVGVLVLGQPADEGGGLAGAHGPGEDSQPPGAELHRPPQGCPSIAVPLALWPGSLLAWGSVPLAPPHQ